MNIIATDIIGSISYMFIHNNKNFYDIPSIYNQFI